MVSDPTYVEKEIETRPEWELAFFMSEIDNDNAPIGWSKYVPIAEGILNKYYLKERRVR